MKQSNRRKFIVTAAALGAGMAVTAMPNSTNKKKNMVEHHVFFWLKNPASMEDRDKLIEGLKTLTKVDAVRELRIGIQANTEKRDVVDTTWHVSELMFFDDLQAQSTYQKHPIHLDFIKNYSHLWDKVVVYDIMEVYT